MTSRKKRVTDAPTGQFELEERSRRVQETWDEPSDHPAGTPSGSEISLPRDREAVDGEDRVEPGFTGTGTSGSQGGRALYGIAPEGEPDADETLARSRRSAESED